MSSYVDPGEFLHCFPVFCFERNDLKWKLTIEHGGAKHEYNTEGYDTPIDALKRLVWDAAHDWAFDEVPRCIGEVVK